MRDINFFTMKTINYLIVIAVLTVLVSGCKKSEDQQPLYLGFDYFPINNGHELIYDADSIITDEFSQTTRTHHFQIKEIIDSTYLDNEGRPTQLIERYIRDSSNAPWIIFKVASATITNTRAERFEDNIRYVKLVFPVNQDINWNGNALNTNETKDYQYTDVHTGLTLNGINYDSVLTVLQDEEINLIENRYFLEQYAARVGMIYKENIKQVLDFNNQTVKSGYIYKETLISYTP